VTPLRSYVAAALERCEGEPETERPALEAYQTGGHITVAEGDHTGEAWIQVAPRDLVDATEVR